MAHRGIKFYSPDDWSSSQHLKEAQEFFENWEENTLELDINTVLELYNIKRYFDLDMRLKEWSDEQFAEYQNRCKQIPGIIGKFCGTITDTNLGVLCREVDWNYTDDFWALVGDYKVYQRIRPQSLKAIMESEERVVWNILKQKVLVMSFGQVITEHLVHNPYTADNLIKHYLAAHDRVADQIYFPKELTQEMRKQILWNFVDQEDCNINSLQLLEQAQSTKEFPVSDRLKLKARKKHDLLQDKLFSDSAGMSYGAEVSFKSIPDGSIIEESFEDNVIRTAYSSEWVKKNQDYPTLFNNFIYLFGYVDSEHRCNFVSLKSELGVLEWHVGVKGKRDYPIGIAFNLKRMRSLLQIAAYQQELQKLGIRLEELFKWFFEKYLKDEFNAEGFTYSPPSEGTTYSEKCKLLAIAIDGVLKQYRLYCEDGYVDRELLEMSSGHIVFESLVSMRDKKYAYCNSDDLSTEQFLLYSDQSMMCCTQKTGDKYHTLPQLLTLENMRREDFEEYQKSRLDWLISRGVVRIADEGRIHIDKMRAYVLKDLFTKEVICPEYYDDRFRQLVETLVADGDLRYENTLFSKLEQDYLNYILNKSEFSNGLDLRNRYSHDTCSLDEKQQYQDYLELLKIMVLIIIKVNEELCVRYPQ